jgi:hypothetical protein
MEVMEQDVFASKGKANAGLTLGIIGTALGGLIGLKDGVFNGILVVLLTKMRAYLTENATTKEKSKKIM